MPLAAENDPKAVFDRLFRPASEAERASRDDEFRRRSVVDTVLEDARSLDRRLGKEDRERLDQYLGSIREVEKDLEREIEWAGRPTPTPNLDGFGDYDREGNFEIGRPEGNGAYEYDTYAKLIYDLIAFASQTDSTRVVSYVVRTELAGGVCPEFGVTKGYHELTHHGNAPKNLEELAKVDTIYQTHWARFLDRLRSIPDGDGTLLDHTLLGYSSGMGRGAEGRGPRLLPGRTGRDPTVPRRLRDLLEVAWLRAVRRPPGRVRQLERRNRVLPVALEERRSQVPAADRSRVGVRLPGMDTVYSFGNDPDDAYDSGNVGCGALEAAHPGTVRLQRGQAEEGGGRRLRLHGLGRFQEAQPVGAPRPARQRVGVDR